MRCHEDVFCRHAEVFCSWPRLRLTLSVLVVENFGSYYLEMKKREVVTAKKKLLEERQRQDKASGQVQRERLAQLLKVRDNELF